MKLRPVRICDVSRILRLSSASLIDFLHEKGYNVIGDYLSPLSSKMVELIQNGFHEGPPFQELNTLLAQADVWEQANPEVVNQLHTAPPRPPAVEEPPPERKPRKPRQPRIYFAPPPPVFNSGRISLGFLDLELIHRMLALEENQKIAIRDYLRRKTILKALSQMD